MAAEQTKRKLPDLVEVTPRVVDDVNRLHRTGLDADCIPHCFSDPWFNLAECNPTLALPEGRIRCDISHACLVHRAAHRSPLLADESGVLLDEAAVRAMPRERLLKLVMSYDAVLRDDAKPKAPVAEVAAEASAEAVETPPAPVSVPEPVSADALDEWARNLVPDAAPDLPSTLPDALRRYPKAGVAYFAFAAYQRMGTDGLTQQRLFDLIERRFPGQAGQAQATEVLFQARQASKQNPTVQVKKLGPNHFSIQVLGWSGGSQEAPV
jgi:hypothetical protein